MRSSRTIHVVSAHAGGEVGDVIVGGVALMAALIMIKGGMSKLKASSLAPTRTTENVRRDVSAIRETTNG